MRSFWLVAWRDLKMSARLLILLSIAVALVAYAMTAAFPEFRERMLAAGKHAPAFVRKLIASRSGLKVENFVGIAFIHPVVMGLMTAWAVSRASRAVAGEAERGALGWLLAYPVGRGAFLWARALVMLGGVAFMQLALFLAFRFSFGWLNIANAGWKPYAWAGLGGFCFYGAIGALALWASAAASRAAIPNMVGAGLAVAAMLLETVGNFYPIFEGWSWLSLLHYYKASDILTHGQWNLHDGLILAGVLLVGLVGATVTFVRRDLNV
jgi:ABC-type transport system involved in multi-copper enzyme maturation permease subunit